MHFDSHPSCAASTVKLVLPATNPGRQPHSSNQLYTSPSRNLGAELLEALWRDPECHHQIGTLNRHTGTFRNIPVKDALEATACALRASNAGHDVFFACAEYLTPDRRVAANASGTFAFWIDIDCGEDKAATGKGYATEEAAESALKAFCKDTGIPAPTHVVSSGSGLHSYWVLAERLDRATWQTYARKLKALTHAKGLLADDSRTADIASVLRVPGTLNFKYAPPRPVTLKMACDAFIAPAFMLAAIDRAVDRPVAVTADGPSGTFAPRHGAPDLQKLVSALVMLDPDCDDATWKLRRLAPMAGAARDFPEYAEDLRELAKSWSGGELRGRVAKAWVTPGSNGRTGQEVFDEVWQRFLKHRYAGKPITLATIYFDAIAVGWSPIIEQFEPVDVAAQGGEL